MKTIVKSMDALMAFHFVATESSFTRAAEVSGSSKAMLSKQVRRLEDGLKSRLFHRTTRKVHLTAEGGALLAYTRKIFELSNEAQVRLSDMARGETGVIRISTPVSFGDFFSPSFLPKIRKTLPGVRFEVDLTNEHRDFMKDRIDFMITALGSPHPDLNERCLGRIKDVLCATPEFVKGAKIGKDPGVLCRLECIRYWHDTDWNIWTLNSHSGDYRVEAGGNLAVNHFSAARALCLQGFGIARLPLYAVIKDIDQGRLVSLFQDFQIATHPLFLVYLRDEFSTKKHEATKKAILDWFGENQDFFVSRG
jgi:DNA-binding transcriptional LysR family regulator